MVIMELPSKRRIIDEPWERTAPAIESDRGGIERIWRASEMLEVELDSARAYLPVCLVYLRYLLEAPNGRSGLIIRSYVDQDLLSATLAMSSKSARADFPTACGGGTGKPSRALYA
jgi:hypothetical protein